MEFRVIANCQETRFELPTSIKEDGAQETISRACDLICDEYVRLQAGSVALAPTTRTWFRPVAYGLISHCIEFSINHLINRRSLEANRYRTTKRQTDNEFSLAIMGILAHRKGAMDERTRYNLANEMMYSFRHYVPRPFINGFVSQSGKLTRQKTFEYIDPDFEDWIVSQRLLDRLFGSLRGSYPRRIEERILEVKYDVDQRLGAFFAAWGELSRKRSSDQMQFMKKDDDEAM